MPELLLRPRKSYSATSISRFSVKEICDIVSFMSLTAENKCEQSVQIDAMQLNERLYALLKKISNQDKAAFEELYDSTIKLCFSHALRFMLTESAAEEVVSDVYLQVWNSAGKYNPERSSVTTWLMMLCRSRAIDALRKLKNQREKESVDFDVIADESTDESPQDILTTVQQDSELHSALNQLKFEQRQLLSLAYFKNLTHQEIANFTGIPLGTVKTQIRRAISRLKEIMNKQELSEGISHE